MSNESGRILSGTRGTMQMIAVSLNNVKTTPCQHSTNQIQSQTQVYSWRSKILHIRIRLRFAKSKLFWILQLTNAFENNSTVFFSFIDLTPLSLQNNIWICRINLIIWCTRDSAILQRPALTLHRPRLLKSWVMTWARRARWAYNGGVGAKTPAGYRKRAPGHGIRGEAPSSWMLYVNGWTIILP